MRKRIGWLWTIPFFGLLPGTAAQTGSAVAASPQFDGSYTFVSSTKVNETYMVRNTGRLGKCPDRGAARLTIENGQARYRSGYWFEGRVGPQGDLAMRSAGMPLSGGFGV